MIFTDFFRAVSQLSDRRFRRVLWLGVGLSFALLVGAYALLLWLVQNSGVDQLEIPGIGPLTWLGDLLSWGSLLLMIIFSVVLMLPVASVITSFFLDDVADAVEARHYPSLTPMPRTTFFDGLRDTVNFLGVLIIANIGAIVLYALLPFAAPLIYIALNGFLLGREYFQLAAGRRIGRENAKKLRARHKGTIWFAGCLMAIPLAIPLVNLLVPVLGAATFTHLFHRLNNTRS